MGKKKKKTTLPVLPASGDPSGKTDTDEKENWSNTGGGKHPWPMLGFPGGDSGKVHACQCRRHKRHVFDPWGRKIPWRRAWQPTPINPTH